MCSTGSAIAGLNTLASCPREQLIVTNECVPISQACGGGANTTYFTNPFTNTVFNGLIQVNNTGTCVMTVYVTDANGAGVAYTLNSGAGVKVAVENLTLVQIFCTAATTGTAAICTGKLYLELHQCVTCY